MGTVFGDFEVLLMRGLHLNYGDNKSIQSSALLVSDVGCYMLHVSYIEMGDV